MIKPDPSIRKLFEDIDRTKVWTTALFPAGAHNLVAQTRVWALTNAYKSHASRVLKILDVEDLIEGDFSNVTSSQDDLSHLASRPYLL
jgi:pyrimidine and pyridine-specific 5'-nucleotidase